MYGKIFDSIYDGTLAEDWRALITFQQLIVLCDADGIVDMTPSAISRRTGIPIEHIKAGLEILSEPDQYSRTQDDEGRRILLIDAHRPWGWLIVNHNKYKNLKDADTVRAQTRLRVQKHRDSKKLKVTESNGSNVDVTEGNGLKRHTDTDTDINIKTKDKVTENKFSDDDLLFANEMYKSLLVLNPKHKQPNFDRWAESIRLIRERDNKTIAEIRELWEWVRGDDFWQVNILSPPKLREKWDQLMIKRNRNKIGGRQNENDSRSRAKRVSDTLDELAREAAASEGIT